MKGENTMNPQQAEILRDIVQRMMARYMTIRPLGIDLGNKRKLVPALKPGPQLRRRQNPLPATTPRLPITGCRQSDRRLEKKLPTMSRSRALHRPGALGSVVRKLPLQAPDCLHFRQKLSALHR